MEESSFVMKNALCYLFVRMHKLCMLPVNYMVQLAVSFDACHDSKMKFVHLEKLQFQTHSMEMTDRCPYGNQ